MKEFKIQKRYNKSVKLPDGSYHSFGTELEVTVNVSNGEELLTESDKLFAQCRFLVDEDIKKTLGA